MPVKLLTSGGGGVNLVPSSSIASDQTMYLPTSGTSGGTVLCTDSTGGTANGVLYLNGSKQVTSGSGLVYNSSGNLGIGTSSPSKKLTVIGDAGVNSLFLSNGAQDWGLGKLWWDNTNNIVWVENNYPGALAFKTNATERMRIDSSGWVYLESIPTTAVGANMYMDAGTSPSGKIYRSTSSLRYKTDVVDLTSEKANRLFNFRPVEYKSLTDTETPSYTYYGFIAEELAQVEPRLVHWIYDKDQYEDVDGELKLKEGAVKIPDGVQYDRITALLVKAIQEQQAIIESLTQRIEALEYTKQGE